MKRVTAIVASLLGVSTAASAQTGSSPTRVTAEGLTELHNYSRCVVRDRPGRVQQVLAIGQDDPGYDAALEALTLQAAGCTRGRLAAGGILFAGTLAEHLVVRRLGGRNLAAATGLDPAAPPLQASNGQEYMALCQVRAHPDKVAALFATQPGSREEARAMAAMQPDLQACLPQGVNASFNRPALRALLAMASLRLINHRTARASASADE